MKQIIIIGTGGNCIDILDTLHAINIHREREKYVCLGFLDDNKELWGKEINGFKVLGGIEKANEFSEASFSFGIGSIKNFHFRDKIREKILLPDNKFEIIIHPSAVISIFSQIGFGTVILQNVTIASNAIIGNHVVILPNSVVSHDNKIDDFTIIAGGVNISGNVHIEKCSYIGSNSSIKEGTIISKNALIGMGSVVLKDVDEGTVVAGNPAHFIRKTNQRI